MADGIRERKRAFWREVIQRWAASGLSKAEYARQNGVPVHQLTQWALRYPEWAQDAESVTPVARSARSPQFITVHAPESVEDSRAAPASTADCEPLVLTLTSGERLEIRPGFCARTLHEVVEALAR